MKRKAVISLLLALFMALCPILLPAGGARQAEKARIGGKTKLEINFSYADSVIHFLLSAKHII